MKNVLLPILLLMGLSVSAQYYTQDFEAGVPADWTVGGQWMLGNSAAAGSQFFGPPSHTNFMYVNDDALGQGVSGNGTVVSEVIDLSAATLPGLFMELYFIDGDYGGDETAKVLVSTDDGTTWTEAISFGASGGWSQVTVPLDSYAGQSIRLAFEYQDGGAWNYGYCFDDIVIDELATDAVSLEVADVNCALTGSQTGVDLHVTGIIRNNGLNPITAIDFNYTVDGTTYTETVTGFNIGLGETAVIEHPTTVVAAEGTTNFDIWISNPNGIEDPDMSDNMGGTSVLATSDLAPGRKVVVEEGTGTWCQFCPRGAVYLDKMSECYPDHFIGIAVHNDDPMELSAYDNAMTSFPGFTGFPFAVFERIQEMDPSDIVNPTLARAANEPTALITNMAELNETINGLTVTLEVEMLTTLGGDYKLTAVLTEDGVTGTGSGYAQTNAYAGGALGPMGGYEYLPGTIPASDMVYNHVGRSLIGGYAGSSNSLPDTLFVNQTYRFTFPIKVIPASQNIDNMHIVGMFTAPNGQLVNAESTTIADALDAFVVSNKNIYVNDIANVFPNPFSETLNIELQLDQSSEVMMQVYNSIGQKMDELRYGELGGHQLLKYDGATLQNGVYFIHIYVDDKLITKKVTLTR